MIPITLRLHNFLSYGENVPPLDFTSFKLACLTGRNGHGKSALLDAMTWAVWGEARKAGYSRTPDADLLRQNALDMFVEFTFSLNDCEYRVYREYNGKRRTGKLEFRVREDRNGDFILLTGTNKRDTQKRIDRTLGLDYRTFVNSSFLQQGKADEFTRQSPKERKEILCNILGLDRYDLLLEEARRRLSELRALKKALDESLGFIETELEGEDAAVEREKTLDESLQEKEKALTALRKEIQTIQNRINELQSVRERVEREREEETRIKKRLEETNDRETKLKKTREEAHQLITQEKEIQQRFQRYEAIGKELHDLLEIDERFQRLDAQRLSVERTIDERRNKIQQQLTALKTENQQIQKTKAECKPILDAREEIEKNYTAFEKTVLECKRLEEKKPTFDGLLKKLQEIEKAIEAERQSIAEKIAERRGAIQTLPALQKEIERIKAKLAQNPALETELKRLNDELASIERQGHDNNQRVERADGERERCERSITETREKLDLLEKGETHYCPLCDGELDESKQAALLQRFQNELTDFQEKLDSLRKQIQQGKTKREELGAQYKTTQKKRNDANDECVRAQSLENELKTRQSDLADKQKNQQEILKLAEILEKKQFAAEARAEAEKLRVEIEGAGFTPEGFENAIKRLNRQRPHELRWNQLRDALKRQTEWNERETEISAETGALQTRLDKGEFALDEKKLLQKLKEEIEPLKKSLEKRKTLSNEQRALNNAPSDWHRLTAAKERLPELDKDIFQLERDRDEGQKRLKEIAVERDGAAPALKELEEGRKDTAAKEKLREDFEKERGDIQLQLGAVRQKIQHLKTRREELKTKREQMAEANRDERLYKTLAAAFSRNGIPAMIVDRVLPELQNDANELLHRLSGGTCSLALESQRETRSGGVSETLDIKISDEMGTRDYEMFSGGEAFRTDLALRVALSQLLCRRAGSKLQLLVVDEGFGTQDSEGVANIVDAVNEIQDEFEKILIVTHLEELKERFQVRIEVVKELGLGSRFDVVYTA